jgi:hypothetical protein
MAAIFIVSSFIPKDHGIYKKNYKRKKAKKFNFVTKKYNFYRVMAQIMEKIKLF